MKKILSLALTLSLIFSQSVFSYNCNGKVKDVTIGPSGELFVSYGTIDMVRLCNVSTAYNGVTPEACKATLSILMAAKMGEREVAFWFNDASNNCTNSAHPSWSNLNNWYFGPALI